MAAITSPEKPKVTRPPRDGLVRAQRPGLELRSAETDTPTLFGHFAVFNRWTEIDSWFEGNFMERIAPGAFKKTFKEQRSSIRCLFQHGRDPQVGDKSIGAISILREDSEGAYYEVSLFKGLSELVLEGLRADQYGASFRFRVMREEFVEEPGTSEHNPKGIPERTLKELHVPEFGPVTFPAYAEASAGCRSLTDYDIFERLASSEPDKIRELFEQVRNPDLTRALGALDEDQQNELTRLTEELAEKEALVEELRVRASDLRRSVEFRSDENETGTEDEAEVEAETEVEASREDEQGEADESRDPESDKDEGDEAEESRNDSEDEVSAAPEAGSTPLNTAIPRSKRGNKWELPARRGRKTPRPPVL